MKVLITGTSRGIGRGVAEEFLAHGHTVIGMDVSEGTLHHDSYTHIVADISCGELPCIDGVLKMRYPIPLRE